MHREPRPLAVRTVPAHFSALAPALALFACLLPLVSCAPAQSPYAGGRTLPPPIVTQPSTPRPTTTARLPDAPGGQPTSTGSPSAPPPPPPSRPTPPAPPPPSPRSTDGAGQPTSDASAPPRVSQGPIPLEFHVQISTMEHLPEARGLGATVRYPTGLPIYTERVKIVYEWRPEDGKEKRINPRTGQPYGPIWKPTLAEQMEPENLERHLATMEAWLISYVPRNYGGVVCLDVEAWTVKGDDFHLGKPAKDEIARRAPGKKQADLMAEFIRRTEARARELRPNVTHWGWWGMGAMHPGWPVWNPDQYAKWKRTEVPHESRALAGIQSPMPEFYYLYFFQNEAERRAGWDRLKDNWVQTYGRERLARDGYAYLNVTHHDGPRKSLPLTRAEFRECYEAAASLGMRRFVIWGVIESVQARNNAQTFIDETLVPEVRRILAEERQGQTGAPAPAAARPTSTQPGTPPTRSRD